MTYEADELAQMEFPVERQMVHLIMKSDWLKSAFSQFDNKSGTDITFMFTPTPSTGWSAPREPTTYHNNQESSRRSLRVDDTGFLSLQLLIPLEEASTMKRKCGYVEFMCVPIEDG
ncbi:ssDNA endodeoxyribonuclease [Puccinia graminis f. sp. tritici]|nr:ssDNA endodeoxyribonuclease [Puccinia graminis f. sp. tritici]